ncbi:MAG: alpha/beta hydrolase [Desulfobacterales bacterium CG23_combo_of_CG06-09_8_20_14_all_51_8]|nr:MAG: alpha/beta hydrolase [Desulfobacterales bacterium CG23_combo_of_CG06-09_8_20_14_all_51_8]
MKKNTPHSFLKIPSDFTSKNTRCSGELYLPEGIINPPVVIMAHGFGAEKAFGLPAYAETFAGAGLAVFLFDYRCFGTSDGGPRNYVDQGRHLQDWKAAIEHVRSIADVNTQKIALWGSSFSGGHVIVTAARDHKISAIVAQVPFVDSISTTFKLGGKFLLQAAPHAIRDLSRIITFRSPHYVKIIGKPDEFAIMNTPESYAGYSSLIPKNSTWENKCPARILLRFGLYRPIASAHKVQCPALIMLGQKDSLINAAVVEKTAKKIPNGQLVKYPFGHFDIYTGSAFKKAVKRQTEFLLTHLRPE